MYCYLNSAGRFVLFSFQIEAMGGWHGKIPIQHGLLHGHK